MCGRFAQSIPLGKLNKIDLYDKMAGVYLESFNVAPSQDAFTLSLSGGSRILKPMKWGLVPSWTKPESTGSGLINARFETLTEKPSFRKPYKERRCVIPVAGFFEWKKEGKLKIPYFINRGRDSDGDFNPMLLGGIYDIYLSPSGESIETFAVITVESAGKMKAVHHRMPLIIDYENVYLWTGSGYMHDIHNEAVRSFNAGSLDVYPVSGYVNTPSNNSNQCITPL